MDPGEQFGEQIEENPGAPSDKHPNEYGPRAPPDTPLVGLWSRRSGVRVPSLTLRKCLQIAILRRDWLRPRPRQGTNGVPSFGLQGISRRAHARAVSRRNLGACRERRYSSAERIASVATQPAPRLATARAPLSAAGGRALPSRKVPQRHEYEWATSMRPGASYSSRAQDDPGSGPGRRSGPPRGLRCNTRDHPCGGAIPHEQAFLLSEREGSVKARAEVTGSSSGSLFNLGAFKRVECLLIARRERSHSSRHRGHGFFEYRFDIP